MSLSDLPTEILLSVGENCSGRTLLRLTQTCRKFRTVLNRSTIWRNALRNQHRRWGDVSGFNVDSLTQDIRKTSEKPGTTEAEAELLKTELWAKFAVAEDDSWEILSDVHKKAPWRSKAAFFAFPLARYEHPLTTRLQIDSNLPLDETIRKDGPGNALDFLYATAGIDQPVEREAETSSLSDLRRSVYRSMAARAGFDWPGVSPTLYAHWMDHGWDGFFTRSHMPAFGAFVKDLRRVLIISGPIRCTSVVDALYCKQEITYPRPPITCDVLRSSELLVPYASGLSLQAWVYRRVRQLLDTMSQGTWVGYYQAHRVGTFDPPMKDIRFSGSLSNNQLEAEGVDSVGSFSLRGIINSRGEMDLFKQYHHAHSWQIKAIMTPWGIFGAWGTWESIIGAVWIFRSEWVREWSESDMPYDDKAGAIWDKVKAECQ